MHTQPEVDDESNAKKPLIIKYYNETKGGVDLMDKMLSEYSTKRKTRRWPQAMFHNMEDVCGLATYIIEMENHPQLKNKSDSRRFFLKELALELCKPAIQTRSMNPLITSKYFIKTATESCLGYEIIMPVRAPIIASSSQLDTSGKKKVVGSCKTCSVMDKKQRKTRNFCFKCMKPVCLEHSESLVVCNSCGI